MLVILDYGDILVNVEKLKFRQFRALKLFGVKISREKAKEEWNKIKGLVHKGEISLNDAVNLYLERIGLGEKVNIYLSFLRKFKGAYLTYRTFPDVEKFLRSLKEIGARIVIASDTGKSKEFLLKHLGDAAKYIDEVYVSKDFGKVKGEGFLGEVLKREKAEKAEKVFFVCHDEDEAEEARKLGIEVVKIKNGYELDKALRTIRKNYAFSKAT